MNVKRSVQEKYSKYGAVYTPDMLSEFISELVLNVYMETKKDLKSNINVLDPACGDGALISGMIKASKQYNYINCIYHCVDIDENATNIISKRYNEYRDKERLFSYTFDSLIPLKGMKYEDGWKEKAGENEYDIIITNPPWGAEFGHNKEQLKESGYTSIPSQIDSYHMFIELCLTLLRANGLCIMILPDSIFNQETSSIREFLIKNTSIKLIARLGEKIFSNINRATSLLMFSKKNDIKDKTSCFRLDWSLRRELLSNQITLMDAYKKKSHSVHQSRFASNKYYKFDIDVLDMEEVLLYKIEKNRIDWSQEFKHGRGVEISKSGLVIECENCGNWQGVTKAQLNNPFKRCSYCKTEIDISKANVDTLICEIDDNDVILAGEDISRYKILPTKEVKLDYKGIKYKDDNIYKENKLLIRKTGLGINASVDTNGFYITQTIYYYILNKSSNLDLFYVLGVLNSRIIFYYYLKKFGEIEWKSHPYLTHSIINQLPVQCISEGDKKIVKRITKIVKEIVAHGYDRKLDLELERLVMKLYDITTDEYKYIINEINKLPDLGAINDMKVTKWDYV